MEGRREGGRDGGKEGGREGGREGEALSCVQHLNSVAAQVVGNGLIPRQKEKWPGSETMIGSSQYIIIYSQYMPVYVYDTIFFYLSGCSEVYHTAWHAHASTTGLYTPVYYSLSRVCILLDTIV